MSGSRHEWLDDETAERLLNGEPARAGDRLPAVGAPGDVHPLAMVHDAREVDAARRRRPRAPKPAAERGDGPADAGTRCGADGHDRAAASGRSDTVGRALAGLLAALSGSEPARHRLTAGPSAPFRPPAAGTFAETAGMPPAGGVDPLREELAVTAFRHAVGRRAGESGEGERRVNDRAEGERGAGASTVGGLGAGGRGAGEGARTEAAVTPHVNRANDTVTRIAARNDVALTHAPSLTQQLSGRTGAAAAGADDGVLRIELGVASGRRTRRRARSGGGPTRMMVGSVVTATLLATGVAAAAAGVLPSFLPGGAYAPATHGHHHGHHVDPVPPRLPEPAGSASATPTGTGTGTPHPAYRRAAHLLPSNGPHPSGAAPTAPAQASPTPSAGTAHLVTGEPQKQIEHLCAKYEESGGPHAPGRLTSLSSDWPSVDAFCSGVTAAGSPQSRSHVVPSAPPSTPTASSATPDGPATPAACRPAAPGTPDRHAAHPAPHPGSPHHARLSNRPTPGVPTTVPHACAASTAPASPDGGSAPDPSASTPGAGTQGASVAGTGYGGRRCGVAGRGGSG